MGSTSKGYRTKEWTTRAGLKRGGSKFTKSSIRKYIKNPVYLGLIKHKGDLYKGEHPAIIDERTFEMVQALLAKNDVQHKSDNKDKHNFLLRGLIRCTFCGSVMTPHFSYSRGRKYFYYRCTKVNHLDRTACNVREAPARETEKLIVERLKLLSNDRGLLDKIIQKAKMETVDMLPSLRQEINIQNGELRRIEGEASNLMNVLISEGQDPRKNSFILKRLNELEEKKRAVEGRIEELKLQIEKREKEAIDAGTIERNFGTFGEVFGELTPPEQRELLQLLIKEVLYDADKSKIRMALRPLPDIGPYVNHQNGCFDVVSSWLLGRDSNPRLGG
jgi:site-specific DNA recombinase